MSKTDEYRWLGWERGSLPQPVVVERCGYCDFQAAGTLEQTRQAFEAHECDRPKPDDELYQKAGGQRRAEALPPATGRSAHN